MLTVDFMSQLRNLGVKVWVENESLRYQAPKGAVTPELLKELGARKREIIAFLNQVNAEARAVQETIPALPRTSGGQTQLPLSYSQQSMWFFDQFTKGNPVFNIANAVRIKGNLDRDLMKAALHTIVSRHESLRTTFKNQEGTPLQVIHPPTGMEIPEIDLKQVPLDQMETELRERLTQEARRSFDLENGPLFRFHLFLLSDDESVLSLTTHHIISDAWSNGIFVGEFLKLYEARAGANPAAGKPFDLPTLPIQFADYAGWQKNWLEGEGAPARLEPFLNYWREQLAGCATLQLPTDHPRPKSQVYEGGLEPVSLGPELTQKLKTLAGQEGATLFMVLLAAFQTLLHRYSGQTDILTGTVVANRNRKEIEYVVGYFMNTLVLRTDFSGDPDVSELLRRVKKMVLDAYQYQEIPFDKLLEELKPERDISRTPFFQTMFILHNTPAVTLKLPGVEMEQLAVETRMAPFDFRLQLTESETGLKGGFDYSSALFDPSTVRRMALHFQNLLAGMVANPKQPVSRLPLLTSAEEELILNGFNDTRADFPREKVIHRMFEEQVARSPEQIAVIFENQQLTYNELNQKANQLARRLIAQGVTVESIVGIMLERSLEMSVALMAVHKAGAAYLPIDPGYPAERIKYMLEDSGAAVLLTQRKFSEVEVKPEGVRIFVDDEELYEGEAGNPKVQVLPHHLAYVIYTSGSTGKPKGALIEHGSLVNRLNWMQKRYPLRPEDTILQKTPYTFDVSVWELFWWSITGAKVCFLRPRAEKDPGAIVAAIAGYRISVIHFVPSMLGAFLEHLKETGTVEKAAGLRQVFASGEALTLAQVQLFRSLLAPGGTQLANLYGPTEATIDVSYFDCLKSQELESIPIGKPIDNIQLLIIDRNRQLQPVGVPGELCIAGAGVGRGYLNRPELTSEKFIPNDFYAVPEGSPQRAPLRMYRTGDLVKWRPDGNIEFLGRIDFQVKIRGLRIELSEIENTLAAHPLVKECVVTAWEKQPGQASLVGYVALEKGQDPDLGVDAPDSASLQSFLEKTLPEYMVPRIFVFLEALPLSPNGKIDRKALPAPVFTKSEGYLAPQSEVEKILAEIWKEELGLSQVGMNDNFFSVGGHSLLLTRVHNRIQKAFQREFPLIDLFTHSTLSALARYVVSGQTQPAFLQNEDRLQKQKEAKMKRKQLNRGAFHE